MNGAATETDYQSYLTAFTQGLHQLGWTEGQNLRLDVRWSAGDAGLARARAKGTKLGRRPVASAVEGQIRDLRANGDGILKIGRKLGVGTSVVQRVVRKIPKTQTA